MAALAAGGEDDWQVDVFGQISHDQHIVLEFLWLDIAYQREEAGLVVDQQYCGLVLVRRL